MIESPNGKIRSSMPGATSVRLVRVAFCVEPAPAEVNYWNCRASDQDLLHCVAAELKAASAVAALLTFRYIVVIVLL